MWHQWLCWWQFLFCDIWILLEEMNEFREDYWRNVSSLQQLVSGTKVRKQKFSFSKFVNHFPSQGGHWVSHADLTKSLNMEEIYLREIYVCSWNILFDDLHPNFREYRSNVHCNQCKLKGPKRNIGKFCYYWYETADF